MEANNNAMLREVVKELLDAMYDMGIDEETVSIAAESPNCHMHSAELLSVIKKAKAALAKPPRNCDVYRTSWDVITHYSTKSVARLLDWLFAPATEQKGENDESV